MPEKIQPFHIRLTERDRQRIAMIRETFGCISDAAAIRHAIIITSSPPFTSRKSAKKVSQGA